METSSLTVTPVTAAVGADIAGVDLSQPLTNAAWDRIHGVFLAHHVLRFHGQNLSPAAHLEFARRFGAIVSYPFGAGIPGHPDVLEIKKNPADLRTFGNVWHTDTTYTPEPPMATMLVARETPPAGGDTAFLNTHLAFATLSPAMQAMLDRLSAVNSANKRYGAETLAAKRSAGTGVQLKEAAPDAVLEAVHPVVRRHPETGRPGLYVNPAHTVRFDGWSEAESAPLLDFLFRHQQRPEFQCRLNWRNGTLVVWDNRSVQHYAIDDYAGQSRIMHRVTIAGDAPH